MSLASYLGRRPDLMRPLSPPESSCLVLESPILSPQEFAKLCRPEVGGLKVKTLDITWPAKEGADAMRALWNRCAKMRCGRWRRRESEC